MFGQLFSARLRAAEKALREGRIDEAHRLASSPDLREDRGGRAVLAALGRSFFDRAREHFHADRFEEALEDLDRAGDGGGLETEIAELRSHVETVAAEAARQAASRKAKLDAARHRIERGSLAAGRDMLERVGPDDHEANVLREDVERRSTELARLIEQAESMLGQGQLAAAAERAIRAKSLEPGNPSVASLEVAVCRQVLEAVRTALIEGRLTRAFDELGCMGDLGAESPERKEVESIIKICREASAALGRHDYPAARRQAMRARRMLPKASWLKETLDTLDRIDELEASLVAGPLGTSGVTLPPPAKVKPKSLDETVALPDRPSAGGLPDRLLMLVDGGGSYLLLRGRQMSIGRAACDRPADIPILSDIAERHANLTRVDDDYFLFASKSLEVGGKPMGQKLLRDGDRVVLGQKAKFTFRVPSRMSATAVLDLSDTTKMPQDVRRVVAFDRLAVIGSGPGAHVICRHASSGFVLYERDGAMWIRRKNDGHVPAGSYRLQMGVPQSIDGVNIVLEPWRHRLPGMPTV